MTQVITRTQEEKLEHVRALIKKYSDHLENVSKLVESGIQFMDEPEMAVFLQVSTPLPPEETNQDGGEMILKSCHHIFAIFCTSHFDLSSQPKYMCLYLHLFKLFHKHIFKGPWHCLNMKGFWYKTAVLYST